MLAALISFITGRRRAELCLGTCGLFGLHKVKVPIDALDTHLYCVGMTGKGKSSYLLALAHQLISHNQGIGLIDPHGDLVSDLLATLASYPRGRPWLSVPENRARIVYLDPRSRNAPPFNPLVTRSVQPYVIAQGVIEAFKRTWPAELAAAPRFANITLHSLLVLIANRLSLLELPQLLTNRPYREGLLAHVQDEKVHHFFHARFDRWGRETSLMIESLLNKATALTLNPFLAPMLGASTCLDLRGIMDRGQILLVNLRTPDEETRNLLGSLLMTSFEQAALTRAALPKARRFFLFVDEFQKFTANAGSVTTLAEILSECRKYGLHLVFAHQSWAQLSGQQRLAGALEQAQVKVIFGSGRQTAQALASGLYLPDPERIKHQVADPQVQDRTHPLFENVANQLEMAVQEIMRLRRRYILVKLPESDTLLRLRTPTLPRPAISLRALDKQRAALAQQTREPTQPPAPRAASLPRVATVVTGEEPPAGAWKAALWRSATKVPPSDTAVS